MNMTWQYLDKKNGTIKALKDYPDMLHILETSGCTLEEAADTMLSLGNSRPSGTPRLHNPKSGESRIIHCIDTLDIVEERYKLAVEFMAWFKPAWDQLTKDDRYILDEFFLADDGNPSSAADNICEKLHIERAWAYKRKNAALDRLSRLLFGI